MISLIEATRRRSLDKKEKSEPKLNSLKTFLQGRKSVATDFNSAEKIFQAAIFSCVYSIIDAERMNAMKILARQLTLDLYNCDTNRLSKVNEIKETLRSVFGSEPRLASEFIDENHCSIIGASAEGHIALHIYKELRYVAVDIFTCTDSDEPEELAKVIRKFFRPDKIKSTFLKRGDFGLEREIKPKIKVRVAPLRRVKNAGAKVVKKLVRRGKE